MDKNKPAGLPPASSAPANAIMYKYCPFCGAGDAKHRLPELRSLQPKMITDGNASAIICQNIKCGAVAPTYTWNNRYNVLHIA